MTSTPLASHGSLFRKRRQKDAQGVPASSAVVPDSSSASILSSDHSSSVPAPSSDASTRPSTAFRTDSSSGRRDSSISSLSDLKGHFRRRSASIRSNGALSPTQSDNLAALGQSVDSQAASTTSLRPTLNVSTTVSSQPSIENVRQPETRGLRPPASAVEPRAGRGLQLGQGFKRDEGLRIPTTAPPISNGANAVNRSVSLGQAAQGIGAPSNPKMVFQHIHDVSSKRISTLDYLKKAHEGRVYWFNAVRFTKDDLYKMPYFDPRKLSRRAANYLLLGVSIPAILDPNKDAAIEYLRAFNSLLNEFESYQSIHTADGTAQSSSLSRGRIPQMFKRSAHSASQNKDRRRGSSATDAFSPHYHHANESSGDGTRSLSAGTGGGGLHSASSTSSISHIPTAFPAGGSDNHQELLPGEEYTFLLTPSLPFDPDYFETFATLCEVLIDCYIHVSSLLQSPESVGPGIGDLFSKVDAKVRKILVAGLVRDFEEASKQSIKSELAGVGKVVLGGLM